MCWGMSGHVLGVEPASTAAEQERLGLILESDSNSIRERFGSDSDDFGAIRTLGIDFRVGFVHKAKRFRWSNLPLI